MSCFVCLVIYNRLAKLYEEDAMSLGERIAHFRKLHQWTQGDLAERLGVKASHISRWETDRVLPNFGTLEKIAEALELGMDELTNLEKPSANKSTLSFVNQIEKLDEEDKALVKRVVDALLTKKRVRAALEAG